jgi:hypothetical protein
MLELVICRHMGCNTMSRNNDRGPWAQRASEHGRAVPCPRPRSASASCLPTLLPDTLLRATLHVVIAA